MQQPDRHGYKYHQIFAFGREGFNEHLLFSQSCMIKGMWLTEDITKPISQLNYIFLNAGSNDVDLVSFGKANYSRIVEERSALEIAFARDIQSLHNIDGFLKAKASESRGFKLVNVNRG